MKKIIIVLLALGGLSCATTSNFEKMLEKWKGKNADELASKLGPPKMTYTLADGTRVHEYRFRDSHDDKATEYRPSKGAHVGCVTRFLVNANNVITGWKWDGHDCVMH